MENENATSQSAKSSSGGKWVAAIVIILIVIAGGFYWYHHSQKEAAMQAASQQQQHQQAMTPQKGWNHKGMGGQMASGSGHMHMDMKPQPTPAMTAQQTQELTAGTSTATTTKTFDINGGNFYFVPNKITVHKGDKVTFILHNDGGFHDLVIDELNVKSAMTMTGKTASVTFTADKVGSFVYYCSVPGHRQKGMWGTLTVE